MIHDAHVGTACCVLSSIDHSILQIHARVTWGVVFIRAIALIVVVDLLTYITNTIKCSVFIFSFNVRLKTKTLEKPVAPRPNTATLRNLPTPRCPKSTSCTSNACFYCTCWLYSLCNFQYRSNCENTGSDHFDC